jgi:hypothetical protein
MNEQFATTLHGDKTSQWRREADESRLAAQSNLKHETAPPHRISVHTSPGRRLLAASTALIFGR